MSIDPSWIQAGSQVLGAVLKPQQPAGPSISGGSVSFKQDADFSGFTVATSGSYATGATNNKRTSDTIGGGSSQGTGEPLPMRTVALIGAGLLALALIG